MPYTSEVDGKMIRFPYLTQYRTTRRFSSKSSSNTRRGISRIFDGRGNGHQRNHDIAFSDVVFDPLAVNGNIAFGKMKSRPVQETLNIIRSQVHPVHFIFSAVKESFTQSISDKAVNPEDQNSFLSSCFCQLLAHGPNVMPSTRSNSGASCVPLIYIPPSVWPKSTLTAPFPQAITRGSVEMMVPGAGSSSLSRHTFRHTPEIHFLSPIWLKAPGKGVSPP